MSDRAHATKYSYQFPIGNVFSGIVEEYWEEMHNEKPRLIVAMVEHYDDDIKAFIEENNYVMIWPSDHSLADEIDSVYILN